MSPYWRVIVRGLGKRVKTQLSRSEYLNKDLLPLGWGEFGNLPNAIDYIMLKLFCFQKALGFTYIKTTMPLSRMFRSGKEFKPVFLWKRVPFEQKLVLVPFLFQRGNKYCPQAIAESIGWKKIWMKQIVAKAVFSSNNILFVAVVVFVRLFPVHERRF